uniref:Uncharacterized protein n=1 Tax=Leersia perrieri TaxID=77586 RepID=A0A0D9V1T9_9ORYZ
MGREAAASSTKAKLRRGLWSPEEDEKLYNHIIRYGVGCWSSVPKLAGLERCGKSCRLRWINYLRPDLKRGSFSQQEEDLIISLHKILGNRWSQIASQLPGRTDNEIKNFWNSCLKKKLRQRGIDPATHKPLNHLADADITAGPEQQQQQHDDDCFAALAAPHSPAVSFDPLSVTNVQQPSSPYGAVVDVISDAGMYSGGGGDSSSNSNSTAWTCGSVVGIGGGEAAMLASHMDMFGRDADAPPPYTFDPWQHHHHHEATPPSSHRLDGTASFPIRSLSRDMPESCFDLGRGGLDDPFGVDFL